MNRALFAALLLTIHGAVAADIAEIPDEAKPFIEKGTSPLDLEKGDLNGDGREDYVLVLERPRSEEVMPADQRPLLILLRGEDGKLRTGARNERVVYCENCGGVWGDPFEGVSVEGKSFTVHLHGGSRWRWSTDYKFAYSRRDRAWQLVRVRETVTDLGGGEQDGGPEVEERIYTPPEDFGKIDLNDFDPRNWKGVGPR